MGGSNPYIEEVKYKPATKKYKVTFLPSGKTIEVDPEKIPYGHNGLPGSILDISEGIKAGLDHACGGVCACSTCHVVVREGLESCNEATDAELDELDEAPGITPKSRLGCQTVPDGTTDIVVEIPEWNKNYAKEADNCVLWLRLQPELFDLSPFPSHQSRFLPGATHAANIRLGPNRRHRHRPDRQISGHRSAHGPLHGHAQVDHRAPRLFRRSSGLQRKQTRSHPNGMARGIPGPSGLTPPSSLPASRNSENQA